MLPTASTLDVKVKAATSLKSSSYSFKKGKTVTLTGSVAPVTATGTIVFERYSGGWRTIGSKTVSGGKATLSYKPKRAGTYKLRARYVPKTGSTNVGNTSASKTLRVR